LDREIPLAVERLLEAEKVLAESASGILDLAETLQREASGLAGFPPLSDRADLTVRTRMGEFVKTSEAIASGLFEKSSFHDLCGQRMAKVREAMLALGELLRDVKAAWVGGAEEGRDTHGAAAGYRDRAAPRGKPFTERPYRGKPFGDGDRKGPARGKDFRDRPSGERPYKGKPYADKDLGGPAKGKDFKDRPYGDRPYKGKPYGDRDLRGPAKGKDFKDRPYGNRPYKGTADTPREKPFKGTANTFKGKGPADSAEGKPFEKKAPTDAAKGKPAKDLGLKDGASRGFTSLAGPSSGGLSQTDIERLLDELTNKDE
jgi:hypothetical protein